MLKKVKKQRSTILRVYLASDHGGFELKRKIISFLKKNKKYYLKDLGPFSYDPADDYPDYAIPLAKSVARDTNSLGIVLCKNGQGVCIAVNKVKGIQGVTGFSKEMVASTRADDHANVLCLPANYISEKEAKAIVMLFLKTPFSGAARHLRRLSKVRKLER